MRNDPIKQGELVRVYVNLHESKRQSRRIYSVQAKREGRWKVCKHVDAFNLRRVSFKVNERQRQKVLATLSKHVHAFVIGLWSAHSSKPLIHGDRVTYNPYKRGSFYLVGTDDCPILVNSAHSISASPELGLRIL